MEYRGKKLLLDNFRSILKGFSVDVQDVVRSAIMDDVDISTWLDSCRDNPYRLDQIRLGMKEGIDVGYFKYKSGEVIRGLRGLLSRGVDMSPILRYSADDLSDKCFLYLIIWCKEGYNFSIYDMSVVPDYLLEFFDFCIRHNINIKKFNNGRQYSLEYVDMCARIIENKCDIDKYSSGTFSLDILSFMEKLASLPKPYKYNKVYEVLTEDMPYERVVSLERAVSLGLNVKEVANITSQAKVDMILMGAKKGVSFGSLSKWEDAEEKELKEYIDEELLVKNRILSGKL